MKRQTFLFQIMVFVFGIVSLQQLHASECGELENAYGPYDYTNPEDVRTKLKIVETRHFTSDVENLIKGNKGYIWGDLDYTLRAFPNHHRALYSMSNYQIKNVRPAHATYYSIECYFDRAMRFKPKDTIVRMLFGIYYHRSKKYDDALKYYQQAIDMGLNSAEVYYNMGLLYFDMGKYDDALVQAKKAYKRGTQLQGLKEKLKEKNMWKVDG